MFSIFFSLVSLTLASSRAFFIQREQKEADPSPSLHMILKVFPYMLIQVTLTENAAQYWHYMYHALGPGKRRMLVGDQHAEGVRLHCPQSVLCGNFGKPDRAGETLHSHG